MKVAPSTINFTANKMSKRQANYFKEQLQNSKNVDIVCHESTDRDSLNSAIAMQRYMDTLGVNSKIIISQELPKLGIMNPTFRYVQADEINEQTETPETVLCVDFSAKERVAENILNHINKTKNVLCIDHHQGTNLFSKDCAIIRKSIPNADKVIETSVPCYVDSSALSATSIIYRFFEALDVPVDSWQAYSLFFGLVDDGAKKRCFVCDGREGVVRPTPKLIENKNALDVLVKLEDKIDNEQIKKVAMAVDILSNLTKEEEDFKNSLYGRINISKNKKVAWVEIPPDDKQWQDLGGDNSRVSTILNRFRQDVLNSREDIETIFVFYEAEGRYRFSVHSKTPTLHDFFNYIEQKHIPDFTKNAGGHKDRAGGKIFTVDPEKCHKWVEDIISCSDFYD